MDLNQINDKVKNCTCGKAHKIDLKAVEIGSGLVNETGKLLLKHSIPKRLILVADNNTLKASEGIFESLDESGYTYIKLIFTDLRDALIEDTEAICSLSSHYDAIISVGTGSLNDICRLASYKVNKPFVIFATAPSMDGFASDTSPIISNGFKLSHQAKQPDLVIADTKILAASPVCLKSAGFGDMLAKTMGLADWRISNILTGEYYCETIANLTREATNRIIALADKVTENDEELAEKMTEALIFTGVAMQLAGCSRPASGAEHVVSHFWEILENQYNAPPSFHGTRVGIALILLNELYLRIADADVSFTEDRTDWKDVYEKYGPQFKSDLDKMNNHSVLEGVTPELLEEKWEEIRKALKEELLPQKRLIELMKTATAPTDPEEIGICRELCDLGIKYHAYMRHRLTLMRLLPMITVKGEENIW